MGTTTIQREICIPPEKWGQISTEEKLDILRKHFEVDSLANVPFWDIYQAVGKFKSP